jgi:hypothetical protein
MGLLKIGGTIIDINTNIPIKGSKITFNGNEEFSDTNGDFSISIPLIYDLSSSIFIDSTNYKSINIIPYKGDNSFKSTLGIIQLSPIDSNLKLDKITSSQLSEDQIDILSKDKKDFKYYGQKKLNDSTDIIKSTLLPIVISLISKFGVVGIQKLIDSNQLNINNIKEIICPTQDDIYIIISQKNKLVKQLNNSYNIIDTTIKSLGISGGIITALDITYNVLKNLPIPSSVPPGVGIPINVILGIQDSKDRLNKIITGLEGVNVGLLTTLILLKQSLSQAIQYLNILDDLIKHCSPDSTQTQISTELILLTKQQSIQESPIVTNVNGFEMGVETESTQSPLKRRRALARDKNGVIMLKGEWSYSSIDQILIDELVFYIQQNNLKAE